MHSECLLTHILGGVTSIGGQWHTNTNTKKREIHSECLLTHILGGGSSIGGHSATDSIFSTRPRAFTHMYKYPYSSFAQYTQIYIHIPHVYNIYKNISIFSFDKNIQIYFHIPPFYNIYTHVYIHIHLSHNHNQRNLCPPFTYFLHLFISRLFFWHIFCKESPKVAF